MDGVKPPNPMKSPQMADIGCEPGLTVAGGNAASRPLHSAAV
jgi:hypothetical protein